MSDPGVDLERAAAGAGACCSCAKICSIRAYRLDRRGRAGRSRPRRRTLAGRSDSRAMGIGSGDHRGALRCAGDPQRRRCRIRQHDRLCRVRDAPTVHHALSSGDPAVSTGWSSEHRRSRRAWHRADHAGIPGARALSSFRLHARQRAVDSPAHRVNISASVPWNWTSGLSSLSEIAAGAFAQQLLGLPFHPKLLDFLSIQTLNHGGHGEHGGEPKTMEWNCS